MADAPDSATDIVLSVRGLAAGYTEAPIIRDVSFELPRRSVTTVIGGNGAGKSTLLRAIYGLNRHFAGDLLLDGQSLRGRDPASRLAAGIGLVPQGRCNFPRLSVRENLELGGYSLPSRKVRAAIERVTALFPMLRRKWRVMAGNLSGGEQQILETAMVLEAEPKLLLLDEPSLGLSPLMLAEVFATVGTVRDAGVTVMMVEQNVRAAMAVSDTVIVLELGTKTLEAPPAQVAGDPRIKAAYLGA